MRAGLEQDITPSVRKLLETRSKNLANRGKNKSVTEQEAVKSTYIRIVPLLIGIDKSDEALDIFKCYTTRINRGISFHCIFERYNTKYRGFKLLSAVSIHARKLLDIGVGILTTYKF